MDKTHDIFKYLEFGLNIVMDILLCENITLSFLQNKIVCIKHLEFHKMY